MIPAENKQLKKKIENSSSWFAFQSNTIIAYTQNISQGNLQQHVSQQVIQYIQGESLQQV